MKKWAIIVALILLAIVLTGCTVRVQETSTKPEDTETGRVLSAKIRYFDGSCDTFVAAHLSTGVDLPYAIVTSEDGRIFRVGWNNLIIIDESEEQYNCMDY